jgi:hypothetical protein
MLICPREEWRKICGTQSTYGRISVGRLKITELLRNGCKATDQCKKFQGLVDIHYYEQGLWHRAVSYCGHGQPAYHYYCVAIVVAQ